MEKVDQVNIWSSDDQSGSRQTRSYTCTFCKRGFSNAQALGGHMNIHRRDRARIRQQLMSEDQNQLYNSEAINKTTCNIDHHPHIIALEENNNRASFQLEPLSQLQRIRHITKAPFCEQQMSMSLSMSSTLKGKFGIMSNEQLLQQLPLFAEEPPTSEADKVDDFVTEELDLELRLGRDTRRDTSLAFTTKEFF